MKYLYAILICLLITAGQNLSAQLSATLSSTLPSCGLNNGSVTVTPSGGSTYTYKWSNNAATSTISNLGSGTYTVTVYSTVGSGTTNWDSIYYESFDSTVQTWTTNISTGANGATNNYWDISDSCIGNGAIGSCVNNTYSPPGGSNKCLYITNQTYVGTFSSLVPSFPGCRYDAGGAGFCGLGICTQTNLAAQSPNISTLGAHNLVLSFQYTGGGYSTVDYASLSYSVNGGTTFLPLASPVRSVNNANCNADGDEEGTWAYSTYVLPGTCVNISNLVLRFNWTNTGSDANGADPSIAVDNVTIRDSVPGSGGSIDSIVKSVTLTARTVPTIVLTSLSVTKATCGQSNGAISGISVSGGTLPLTYKWTNGVGATVGSSVSVSSLASGSYTLLVTDSTGCTASTTVNVPALGGPTIVSAALTVTNASCGQNNGSILGLGTTGGVAPVIVKWVNSTNTTISQTDTLKNVGAGVYTFIVTDSVNCSNDTSITLTGTGAPAVPAISTAKDSLCPGDTATICPTPQNYAHYEWSDGDTTTCTNTPYAGNYYLTITDGNGCTAISNQVQIVQYQLQAVTVTISGDTLKCYPAISYQWYLNSSPINGATSQIYIASAPGTYYVQITDAHGCNEQSTTTVISGINEIADGIDFVIYPNPVNDNMLQITTGSKALGETIEVFDAEGKLVFSAKITGTKTDIDPSRLSGGVYLVRLGNIVKKLIKE